ncbi:glycosyltransferase family 25 protein [Amylibacter sp.]|nr:glycosyltransferase family 25 protein [Amylibacter sp.]
MKCFIINLETSKDRMDFMKEQMNKLSLDFNRINAISERDLIFSPINDYWNTWERPLKNTEKACLLSHINAWKAVIKRNKPTLILEDDALLSNDTKYVLKEASKLTDIDFLSLEVRFRKKLISKNKEKLTKKYFYSRLYQNGSGAAAYILWPSGAKKLLLKSMNKAALTDALISNSRELNCFQIEPACALQLDCLSLHGIKSPIKHYSIINSGINFKRPVFERGTKIKFILRRVISQIIRGVYSLSLITKSEKRFIELNKNKFE